MPYLCGFWRFANAYDVVYMEGVLFKSQIVLLIIIFLIGAFSDAEWIGDADTDLCNIATVYTLIMLYLDKAREVKNKRDEIGYDEPSILLMQEKNMLDEDNK